MTTTPLHIPISLTLSDKGLLVTYESARVTFDAAKGGYELVLEPHEAVIFEIVDFVADSHTYRARAFHRADKLEWPHWIRHSHGCTSPLFTDPIHFELVITAEPASTRARPADTTSTTIINKKGRPEDYATVRSDGYADASLVSPGSLRTEEDAQ